MTDDFEADLALVVARLDHPPLRAKVAPGAPGAAGWRATVRRLAAQYRGDPAPARAPSAPAAASPWLDLVKACPWRQCRSGCQKSRCLLGRGDRWHGEPWGEVSHADCRRCVLQLALPGPADSGVSARPSLP